MGEEVISRLAIEVNINSNGAVTGGKKAEDSLKNIKKTAEKTSKPVNKIMSSLGRIAFYRAIRTVLSGITSGFKEGMSNLYQFSKIAGTTFSSSLDRMSSALMNIKNSLAVAIAPIVEGVVVPVLEKLADVVIKVCNAVARFNAILTGQKSYAIATTGAIKRYNDAIQKSILGFDEINRLSGTQYNVTSAFDTEQVGELSKVEEKVAQIGEKISDLAKKIGTYLQPKIEWLIDNMDKVLITVGAIGGAILLWKVGQTFLNSIRDVASILGVGTQAGTVAGNLSVITGLVAGLLGAKGVYDLLDGFDYFGERGYKDCGKICTGLGEVLESIGLLTKNPFIITIGLVATAIGNIVEYANTVTSKDLGILSKDEQTNWDNAVSNSPKVGQSYVNSLNGYKYYVARETDNLSLIAAMYGTTAEKLKQLNPTLKSVGLGTQVRVKANGGFVDSGELFIAREAGAELVGSVGGHTAVMNNDQIVSAVSTGVYNAVVSAMGNRGGENCVKVYLDSKEIRAGQKRLNKALG